MRPVLVKGGRVIDPSRQLDRAAVVLIQDGRIAAVESNVTAPEGAETIDASGMVVAPGLVDVHVHLREPGKEAHDETDEAQSGADYRPVARGRRSPATPRTW